MLTNNISLLSEKDRALLEQAILRYGEVVSSKDLLTIFSSSYSYQESKDRFTKLVKSGWLVRIYRGLYIIITNLTSLSFSGKSQLVVAQIINPDSYISFAAALQHWGMFDQLLSAIDSVTKGEKLRVYAFENTTYRYHKTKTDLYFGFVEFSIEENQVKIAEFEKALLDYLYFFKDETTARLVLDQIRKRDDLDLEKLISYAEQYNTSTMRALGFLLDLAGLDSSKLHQEISTKGFSRMGKEATQFISKWRLYAFDYLTN